MEKLKAGRSLGKVQVIKQLRGVNPKIASKSGIQPPTTNKFSQGKFSLKLKIKKFSVWQKANHTQRHHLVKFSAKSFWSVGRRRRRWRKIFYFQSVFLVKPPHFPERKRHVVDSQTIVFAMVSGSICINCHKVEGERTEFISLALH